MRTIELVEKRSIFKPVEYYLTINGYKIKNSETHSKKTAETMHMHMCELASHENFDIETFTILKSTDVKVVSERKPYKRNIRRENDNKR